MDGHPAEAPRGSAPCFGADRALLREDRDATRDGLQVRWQRVPHVASCALACGADAAGFEQTPCDAAMGNEQARSDDAPPATAIPERCRRDGPRRSLVDLEHRERLPHLLAARAELGALAVAAAGARERAHPHVALLRRPSRVAGRLGDQARPLGSRQRPPRAPAGACSSRAPCQPDSGW